jgi:hypothetical protein
MTRNERIAAIKFDLTRGRVRCSECGRLFDFTNDAAYEYMFGHDCEVE